MRNLSILFLILILLIGCSENKEKSLNKPKVIAESIKNSTFCYSLQERNLNDTLKQYDSTGRLLLLQIWDNGKLEKTFTTDKYGKLRKLKLISYGDESSFTIYYQDIKDTSFKTIPYDEDTFDFFRKHIYLSIKTIFRDSSNSLKFLNSPNDIEQVAITNGLIKKYKDNYILTTNSKSGDTMTVLLYNPLSRKEEQTFKLPIK